MLPNKALAPYYKKITWLYVCRTFKETPLDLEALRTHDRFGISLWPQMFVFDPRDDRVLRNMPRQLARFTAAFDAVLKAWQREVPKDAAALARTLADARALHKSGKTVEAMAALGPLAKRADDVDAWLEARELLREWQGGDKRPLPERLDDPDPRVRAMALEEVRGNDSHAVKRASGFLADGKQDVVVRLRALRYLAKVAPQNALFHARDLLALANDPLRYEVLALIQKHPEPDLVPVLVDLFRRAGSDGYSSRNPNVVRIRTAQCLAVVGDRRAIAALAGPAQECNPNNGLTRIVFQALGEIGSRSAPVDCARVCKVLVASLPAPAAELQPDPKYVRGMERRCLALARELVAALEKAVGQPIQVDLPKQGWTAEDRARARKAMQAAITVR